MAMVKFNVGCTAIYKSELEIPDEIKDDMKSVLAYIHDHLDECPVNEIEWVSDLKPGDAVMMEDILCIVGEE